MSRLPTVGGDDDEWGIILNDYLSVSLNTDGTLKSASLPASSETASGIVELATTAETTTGTDTVRAVTPAGVKAVADLKADISHAHAGEDITSGTVSATYLPTSTIWAKGIVELATPAEAVTGLDGSRAVTPAGLKDVADLKADLSHAHSGADITSGTVAATYLPASSATASGIVELATVAEAITGTDTARAVTPAGLDAALIVGAGPVTLTDTSTVATDASLGNYCRVTITANRTLGVPSNPTDGQRILWEVTASGADRTLTLTVGSSGAFKFGSDFSAIPVIVDGTATFIGCVYRTSSSRWHVLSVGSGH